MYDIVAWLGSYKFFKKLFPKTANKIDENLSVFAEASAEVLLYKPKQWQLIYKHKFEVFKQELMEKYSRIELEKRCKPKTNIVFPALLNATYVLDEKELKNMYQKLLLSAVNNETVKFVHPSFAYIISQMTPLDAKIFRRLNNPFYLAICNVYGEKSSKYLQDIFLDDEFTEVRKDVSISINNLERLGLIYVKFNMSTTFASCIDEETINRLKKTNYYKECVQIYGENNIHAYSILGTISEIGMSFKKSCL